MALLARSRSASAPAKSNMFWPHSVCRRRSRARCSCGSRVHCRKALRQRIARREATTESEQRAIERALEYMALKPRTKISDITIDRVFIGSCTNARIEDLRAAARVIRGHTVSNSVRAMVVPGSQNVKRVAEDEGLDRIFVDAGFEWRESGCSMCLGMNPDILEPGERCASTSNRNFEGRQGRGGRTHLVSPAMAAAAAVAGHFVDVREWEYK